VADLSDGLRNPRIVRRLLQEDDFYSSWHRTRLTFEDQQATVLASSLAFSDGGWAVKIKSVATGPFADVEVTVPSE
jgi:hypothetical protein